MNKKQELRHNMISTLTWLILNDEKRQFSIEYSASVDAIHIFYYKGGFKGIVNDEMFAIYPDKNYGDRYEDVYNFMKENIVEV
jgi:hypothetical protein